MAEGCGVRGLFAEDLKGEKEGEVRTVIVIPTLNNLEFVQACIASIRKNTEDYAIVVVDDGSEEYIAEKCFGERDVVVLHNKHNAGFPISCNVGIHTALKMNPEYICILNNDTLVTKHWLNRMIEKMQGNVGIVGPCTNELSGIQAVYTRRYNDQKELELAAEEFYYQNEGKSIACHRIVGFCMLIKVEVIKEISCFDVCFSPGNFEDDDLCLRAIQAGYKCVVAKDTYIHHFGSRTFAKDAEKYDKLLERNLEIFEKAWPTDTYNELVEKNKTL